MSDIVIFDKLADIKRLTVDDAFIHLEKRFQKERARLLSRMLDPGASTEETMGLKKALNVIEGLSPMSLAEAVLKIESKNLKSHSPEMWKVKKK